MRLKMRTLLTVLLVLGLVEFGVPQDVYPKKAVGFGSIGESVLFMPGDGKNLNTDPRAVTDGNEKQGDSKSSVEIINIESTQNKTMDSNSSILTKTSEEQDSASTGELLSMDHKSNQNETLGLDSGSLDDNNNKKEDDASTVEGSLTNKNERREEEHPMKLPLNKFESNQNPSAKLNLNVNNPINASNECPSTTVDCLCSDEKVIEHVVHVNLKTISVVDPRTGRRRCFADGNPVAACESRNCTIIPNKNFDTLFQKGKKVYKSTNLDNVEKLDTTSANSEGNESRQATGSLVMDSLLSAFYPVEYTYPRAVGEGVNSRVARSPYGSNLCRVPSLANSEVTCWKWPNWQTCKQVCIYGHGLDNGGKTIKEKSFNCRNTENKWKPSVIRDCEPYLNCKVHLKSPGDLNCVEPTDGPAYCDINCADYDDYVGHGKVRWKCEEKAMQHGGKQNHLPHCAEFEEAELRLGPPQ